MPKYMLTVCDLRADVQSLVRDGWPRSSEVTHFLGVNFHESDRAGIARALLLAMGLPKDTIFILLSNQATGLKVTVKQFDPSKKGSKAPAPSPAPSPAPAPAHAPAHTPAHAPSSSRPSGVKHVACKFESRPGGCTKPDCKFAHGVGMPAKMPSSKMPIRKFESSPGGCTKSNCKFVHVSTL